MAQALFAFEDPAAGHRAVQLLMDSGFPPDAVQVHEHDDISQRSTAYKVDEQITGGLLTNLAQLFQGIFDFSSSPHDPSHYTETVMRGGVVLSVSAKDAEEEATAERLLDAADCDQHTDWKAGGR